MKEFSLELGNRYNALSFRERMLVAITVLTMTWALWISSFGGSVIDSRAVVVTDIDRVEAELAAQEQERRALLNAIESTASSQLVEERNRLVAELDLTDAELDEALARFVPPEEVAGLLEDMIEAHESLDLLRIASQPAEPLRPSADAVLHIYRHPVQVEVKGSYLALIEYLEGLEQSGWGLSWRKLEYVVDKHPDARVVLEVETLSREKEWLGV